MYHYMRAGDEPKDEAKIKAKHSDKTKTVLL